MKHALIGLFALLLTLPAFAERKQSVGDYDIHYIAFHSGFLQPEIAQAAGLVRSKTLGVVNIAVKKAGQPVSALVSGSVKNLLGQDTALSFKQVKEGEAIYYLAQFPIDGQETLRFALSVQPMGGNAIPLQFSQEVFPE